MRFRRSLLLSVLCLLACGSASSALAAAIVQDMRLSATAESTRVVLDLSEAVETNLFTLADPHRVVLDIPGAQFNLAAIPEGRGFVKEFRVANRGNGVLRIVLDVTAAVGASSFVIAPEGEQGHRLVLDLLPPNSKPDNKPTEAKTVTAALNVVKSVEQVKQGRDLVIAIDAGHGGQDPGALGRKGTREKDITLAIARKLKARIDAEPGMRAVLTRDGDYFVPLRERIVRAAKQQADLFISVHADSVHDSSVSGSSVYVLSSGRATNEAARMLADRENAADLMGGISLDDKDNMLASVLLDLSQGASMSASIEAADKVLGQLDRIGNVLDRGVKHASLKVLTSPDMPSMLVETAFISNPKEEARLKDERHQQRLADAILAGVRTYFYDNPPPGTRVAQIKMQRRQHANGTVNGAVIAAGGVAP
jgi:N-acetylmuramoyl-L-alanine amidase